MSLLQKVLFYGIIFAFVIAGNILYAIVVEGVPVITGVLAGAGSMIITVGFLALILVILERRRNDEPSDSGN